MWADLIKKKMICNISKQIYEQRSNRQNSVKTCRRKAQQQSNQTPPTLTQLINERPGAASLRYITHQTSYSFIDFTFHNSISLNSNGSKYGGQGLGQLSNGRLDECLHNIDGARRKK